MDLLTGALAYRKAKKYPELEEMDFCSRQHDYQTRGDLAQLGMHLDRPDPIFSVQRSQPAGTTIVGGGKILKTVPGMGTIYDWRGTAWSQPNGGTIKPLIFVQHIPVVPNMAGIADFVRLRDVLVAQGLMVQNATDKDGNIALYTHMDRLCYQARGANQVSCGTEHMHMTLGEPWSKQQLRASAWLVNQAKDKYGLPVHQGVLKPGNGLVRVAQRGQTTHQRVSDAAGYHDRSDPGSGYDFEYVYHCVVYYRTYGHFANA